MTPSPFPTASRLAFLIPAALVAFVPALHAQAPEQEADQGESPERYAQVKFLEGDATIRKGETEEALTQGTPVAEGDVVESRSRGVLQLGDGSRIAFGPGTRFQVVTLFAERKGVREVLLRLDRGRLRIRVGRQSDASIRVDTPSGTGTIADRAEATFELQGDRSLRYRVHLGGTTFSNERGRVKVRAGERLTVYSNQDNLDRLNDFNTYDEDEFDHWAEPMLVARHTESADRVPAEIRYYAEDLDRHGRWVYVDDYRTWCWSPAGVAADWRPYYAGRWAAYPGGMTWISSEPWGYVTYHHGRWGWGASLGWYWIPGINYSPAWVAWQSDSAYFGWAPLGYYNRPSHWGYGAWGGGACWNVVGINHINGHDIRHRYESDPRVIQHFNRGTAATTWIPGTPQRGEGQSGPWFRGRMMVTPAEFRNPAQIQQVATQRELVQTRVQAYDQNARATTGRVLLRREAPAQPVASPRGETPAPRGFESDRPRPQERPIMRETQTRPLPAGAGRAEPGEVRPRGEERPRLNLNIERRPEPTPERRVDPTPERRVDPTPERRPDPAREHPTMNERRSEPTRETPQPERRPEPQREAPRFERRPEPQREAPRPERRPEPMREAPRMESRPAPAPAPAPRQESRPAPAPAPRQEARPNKEAESRRS